MIGYQQKILKLLVILLIINVVIIFGLYIKKSNNKIVATIQNGQNNDYSNIVFEFENYKYDIYVEKSDLDTYNKFLISITDLNNPIENLYQFSSTFYEKDIISTAEKKQQGFSAQYNLDSEKIKVYSLPLKKEQLDTEVVDGTTYILPPEF